jgi:hypothetical protein
MNFIEARIKMTVNQFNWEFHNNEMEKNYFQLDYIQHFQQIIRSVFKYLI